MQTACLFTAYILYHIGSRFSTLFWANPVDFCLGKKVHNIEMEEMMMRKRILSTLLALCLVLGMLPGMAWATVVASGECGDGVTWSLDDAGTLTIGGTGNMATYSSGERPWADNLYDIQTVAIEHGVTSISGAAFSGCLKLGRVIIPVGITSIPRNAFRQCTNLTSVNIPEGVTSIGIQAFYGCTNLRSLVIPASVDYIEAEALRNIHEQSKLYFNGYLPNISSDSLASDATLYYIAGTAGWDKLALGNETALWGGAEAKCLIQSRPIKSLTN